MMRDGDAECLPKREVDITLSAKTAASTLSRDFLREPTREKLVEMAKEIVERYCDKAQNMDSCRARKDEVLSSLDVEIVNSDQAASRANLKVTFADSRISDGGRRLLQADSIVGGAFTDDEAMGDFDSGMNTPSGPSSHIESGASKTSPLLAVVAILSAFVLV
jgi:hypothetical protein